MTIRNGGDTQANFNVWDWKMQDPNSAIRNSSFTGTENQLHSGEVAPGDLSPGMSASTILRARLPASSSYSTILRSSSPPIELGGSIDDDAPLLFLFP